MRRLSLRGKPVAHRGGLPDLAKTHDSTTESTKTNDFKHTAQTRKRPGKVYAPEPSSNKKKNHRQTTPGGWSPPPDHEIVQLSDSDFQGEPDEEEEEEEEDEVVAARSVALKFDAKPVSRTSELKPEAKPQKKLARDVDATFLVKSSRIAKDKAVRDYPHRYIKKSKRKVRGSWCLFFDLLLPFAPVDELSQPSNMAMDTLLPIVVHDLELLLYVLLQSESVDQESQLLVIAHYKEAKVDGETYLLGDCVHVNVSKTPVPYQNSTDSFVAQSLIDLMQSLFVAQSCSCALDVESTLILAVYMLLLLPPAAMSYFKISLIRFQAFLHAMLCGIF
jgi:hypothetical protein